MTSVFSRVGKCIFIAMALIAVSALAWGQTGTSTVRGTITDPQGKAISGAKVTLKNPGTGFERNTTTNEVGLYRFESVPPADYNIEVEAAGFRKKIINNVHALVEEPREVNVQMELGATNQTVVVEATAGNVTINTQDATLGNNIGSMQLRELPIADRNVLNLLTLQPAVTPTGYVAGARSDQSNITLDGVDINEAQTSSLTSPVLRLNGDAVEEFRVNTVNANADQGRSSAAQINLVTKSGTNHYHGDLFEYNRTAFGEADNFFNNRAIPKVPRTKLTRNTFGVSGGGPIVKDKLFFFYSFEGLRNSMGQSVVETVPLPILGQGQEKVVAAACASCPSTVITLTTAQLNAIYPAVGINPAAVSVLGAAASKYTVNDSTVGDGLNTGGFRFNSPITQNDNSNLLRLDWNITHNQTAFVRYNAIYDLNSSAAAFPDTPHPSTWSHPWGFAIGHNWSLGNNWTNNARYGLTREAFSNLGDTTGTFINFRFIYTPTLGQYNNSRVTPVHNIVDDISWTKGQHTIQFGVNIRIISNASTNFGNSFDSAVTNPSGYAQGGVVVSNPVQQYLAANPGTFGLGTSPVLVAAPNVQNVGTALIGRFSQYTADFIFGHTGALQPVGTPTARNFKTQEYDEYFQDKWKVTKTLTLTFGLRYGLSRPVYEANGFQMNPTFPLGFYFQDRLAAAQIGTNFNIPVTLNLSGPANGGPPMYNWDPANVQPRAAFAWAPSSESGILNKLFGGANKSVLRGGFAVYGDYYGEALATGFDLVNALGFSSNDTIPVNTFNVTTKPAPSFTAFGQGIRTFPKLTIPTGLTFPASQPVDFGERIESSLDSNLTTPKEYTWNLTYERQLRGGLTVQVAYIGRMGRHLLARRDAMALNDLVDPKTGMDWYTAATVLEKIRQTLPAKNTAVPTMAYFDDIFPANLAAQMSAFEGATIPANFTPTQTIFWIARNIYGNDWTDTQADLDLNRFLQGQNPLFFQSQYGALSAWSTIANSMYHGLAFSIRQRYHSSLTWDFNYTWSHSMDDASGLQTASGFAGSAFIENPIRQSQSYTNSDFDLRHVINANAVYQLPFGRGHMLGRNMGRAADLVLGGWQLSGVFRWNTGLPLTTPFDSAQWATNWEVQSATTQIANVPVCVSRVNIKLFGCDTVAAFQSFRNAYPGETGQRNFLRDPGFNEVDGGLTKNFKITERIGLQFRWEVFNLANYQAFGAQDQSRTGFGIPLDPAAKNLQPPSNFSNFTGIQGLPREMQFGLRLDF